MVLIKSMLVVCLFFSVLPAQTDDSPLEVGIDEHLGEVIPLDLVFKDENGLEVKIAEMISKPTILSLVYFHCPTVCRPLMSAKVDVVNRLNLKAGKDFNLLTVSFSHHETPVHARETKAHFLAGFQPAIPENAWRFLTGDVETIKNLTDAVGFRFRPRGTMDFDHPVTLILLSPEGKISRYLYGMQFLPLDMKMGLIEAAEGRIGPTINRVLFYCFSYDPEGKTYAFNILKVTGTITILFLLLFLVWLIVSTRKKRRIQDDPNKRKKSKTDG